MEVKTDTGYQIVARKLMEHVLYDNGAVDCWHPDNRSMYPKKHFDAITKAAEVYFEAHPEMLTDENLDEIASAGEDENNDKFGIHTEYAELDRVLNEWFNEGI